MKNLKCLMSIIAVVLAVAAVVAVIIVFRDRIANSLSAVREKIEFRKADCCCEREEQSDFADM